MSQFKNSKGRHVGRPKKIDTNKPFTSLAREISALDVRRQTPLVRRKIERPTDPKAMRAESFAKYKDDVQSYAKDFFDTTLWAKQLEIVEALKTHNYVCVRSAHSTGKSFLLGILLNYYFDIYYPLIGVASAPTQKQVQNVIFAYARQFRQMSIDILGDFWEGPKKPRIATTDNHYFEGIVTMDPTSLQGRHGPNVILLLDEAVGIKAEMFEALESLMIGDMVKVLAIYNPTDPSSHIASVEKRPGWKVITMSAYDHPNIWTGVERLAEGRSSTEDLPYPGAINLGRFEQMLTQWSDEIDERDYDSHRDVILPSSLNNEKLQYYRPGPIAAARLLGRWPDMSLNTVFSEYEFDTSITTIVPQKPDDELTIGVDVARFGSDFSGFCVRHGNRVLDMFEVNGLSTTEVVGRVVELCQKYGEMFEVPYKYIDIAIDAIGVGAGVYDMLQEAGYNAHEINVAERAYDSDAYFNLRTELWFEVHKLFFEKKISMARVPKHIRDEIKKQLISPLYTYDRWGRRKLESKDDTKKRLSRSPDGADALMMAFAVNNNNEQLTVAVD